MFVFVLVLVLATSKSSVASWIAAVCVVCLVRVALFHVLLVFVLHTESSSPLHITVTVSPIN